MQFWDWTFTTELFIASQEIRIRVAYFGKLCGSIKPYRRSKDIYHDWHVSCRIHMSSPTRMWLHHKALAGSGGDNPQITQPRPITVAAAQCSGHNCAIWLMHFIGACSSLPYHDNWENGRMCAIEWRYVDFRYCNTACDVCSRYICNIILYFSDFSYCL